MTIAISIAGTITVAVTMRLMWLLFLGGRSIRAATLTGRFVGYFRRAVMRFAAGWRDQSWRYRLIAFPCILLTLGGVSALMYWLIPIMHTTPSTWDVVKYCILIFLAGISSCLFIACVLIFGVYFLVEIVGGWWNGASGAADHEQADTDRNSPVQQ